MCSVKTKLLQEEFRAFSAGRSGLWSSVSATAVTPPEALRYPKDVLESPIFARIHVLFLITAQVNVVPEKSVSIVDSAMRYRAHKNKYRTVNTSYLARSLVRIYL